MKKTNIYLGDRQQEQVRKIAKEEGMSSSEIIRRAIDEYLADRRAIDEYLADVREQERGRE